MTLREVPVHTTVKVVKINGEGAFPAAESWTWALPKTARSTFVK